MAAVVTRAAAGTAFESRTPAGTAATTIIWPATASTIVSAAIIAIASAAAERPLEAGARIAADAGGVAREIRARLRSAGTRRARFTGKKNAVIFSDGWRGRGFRSGRLDRLVFGFFVHVVTANGSGMQGALVSCVCFCFAERV
jgi:hypothetical protein